MAKDSFQAWSMRYIVMKQINKWKRSFILALFLVCLPSFSIFVAGEPRINVSTEAEEYSCDDCYGNLIRIVTSSIYHKDISEKINTQLDKTVYARQLELLDYVKGFADVLKPDNIQPFVCSEVRTGFPRINVVNTVLSVNIYSSCYTGGPHPWTRYHTANFDLDTGEILHLSDIFLTNTHWEKMALFLCELFRQIPCADSIFFESDMMTLANKEVNEWKRENPISGWTLTDDGLSFFYYAGEKSVYAAGGHVITFSVEQLRALGIKEKYIHKKESTDEEQNTSIKEEKRSQPFMVKTKKLNIKAEKLKKKKQVIKRKKIFVIKGNQEAVTFKKTSGNRKIIVSKTGKITLKKGLKRGKYRVKVKITISGNDLYKKETKTVVIQIKVI